MVKSLDRVDPTRGPLVREVNALTSFGGEVNGLSLRHSVSFGPRSEHKSRTQTVGGGLKMTEVLISVYKPLIPGTQTLCLSHTRRPERPGQGPPFVRSRLS